MPYTVLALKWRPKDFDEIVGQPHVVNNLKSALQTGKLAHAYLFAGPRGVGKTSTARILAKALNCKDGPTPKPCGKCPSCLEIAQSRSLDVMEIDGASNTGVDDVRVLRENVKFAPTNGKFKVYIIDEVHMLSPQAFNALLKTLEEPPEFVKFIFATTRPEKILPTVLSRCQRLDFRRIPVIDMINHLDKISKAEGIGADKDVLFAIAKASDGSMRDAESILDQITSFSKGNISTSDVTSVLGVVDQDALFGIADAIIAKDAVSALLLFDHIVSEGKDIIVFLNNLIEHFRNIMIAKVTRGDAKLIDLPDEICGRLVSQSESFAMEEIFSFFNTLINTHELSKRLDSLRIPLEIALVKLASDKKSSGPAVVKEPPKKTAAQQQAEPESKKEIQPEPEPPAALISVEEVKKAWQEVIDSVGRIKMYLSSYLNEGEPVKINGDMLTVSFPKGHSLHKESLEKKENKTIIEKAISQAAKADLRVSFILSAEHKPKQESVEGSGFLKNAMDVFGGRIVKED